MQQLDCQRRGDEGWTGGSVGGAGIWTLKTTDHETGREFLSPLAPASSQTRLKKDNVAGR